jgi:hypothetical protein
VAALATMLPRRSAPNLRAQLVLHHELVFDRMAHPSCMIIHDRV